MFSSPVNIGSEELDQKVFNLPAAEVHDSVAVADAVADLSKSEGIGRRFAGFQEFSLPVCNGEKRASQSSTVAKATESSGGNILMIAVTICCRNMAPRVPPPLANPTPWHNFLNRSSHSVK